MNKRERLKPELILILDSDDSDSEKIEKILDLFCPKRDSVNPTLFLFAKEIAGLSSLSLENGAKNMCFKAAKSLIEGINAPKTPQELRPFFAKGGKIYSEWPWSKGNQLKPMDIVKNWPRLSGAIKPPEISTVSNARHEA